MRKWFKVSNVLAMFALAVAAAGTARADISPSFVFPNPNIVNLGGGAFRYEYDFSVVSNQKIKSGDFFVIYDFGGFLFDSDPQPSGWTRTHQLVGPTPIAGWPASDSNAIYNLIWTYSGPEITAGTTPFLGAPVSLGIFTAQSSIPHTIEGFYSGMGTVWLGPNAGKPEPNPGTVRVPAPTPEPGTMALLGLGGAGMLTRLRRRRRSEQA